MRSKPADSPRVQRRYSILIGGAFFLAISGVQGHAQQVDAQNVASVSRPETVLVSDKCPTVIPGNSISLDWYPGFENPGVVTGIHFFRLIFSRQTSDGRPRTQSQLVLGGHEGSFSAATPVNDYFHITLKVPRGVAPGEYHLTEAKGTAQTLPEYSGPAMQMTNSPVDGRFCMTVVPLQPKP